MKNNENINVEQLIEELTQAAKAYYQEDKVLMTDAEYDTKIEYLEELVSKGALELTGDLSELLQTVSAGSEPEGTVVYHDYPMLSLGKAKNTDELKAYHNRLVNGGATGFTLQMKFDGLALSAKYEKGKLTQLATRGDGVRGELLNHLINHDEVSVLGLPKTIDTDKSFELRGELYITDAQFEVINKNRKEVTGEAFSNSRNAATGIVKRSIGGMGYEAELTFTAYSAYKNGEQIDIYSVDNNEEISKVVEVTEAEVKRLSTDELKLDSCTIKSTNLKDLEQAVETFGVLRQQFGVPTDGVVIKPINELEMLKKMGYTSRYPIAYIAFKYPGAKATTVVEEITVSVGKTGRLTPQARVRPVEVDGVIITNLTCHNYSWLSEMGIREGATVAVTRANDVIPAIDTVIDKGPNSAVKIPTHCPECGEKLKGDGTNKTLTCENQECPSRLLYYMKSIVGRNFLYLEGLGDVALEALVSKGVLTSVVDLFKLTEDILATAPTGTTSTGNVRLLGKGNAKNIMKSIERAKVDTDSNKLLASLNFEGMGPGTAKRLIAHFGGIVEVLNVQPEDLTQVNQVGQSLVASFARHQKRAKGQLSELVELGVKINDPIQAEDNVEKKGTFSVSGGVEGFANRNDFVAHMESLGWEFHRSPKKTTDVLFADPNGTSSKIKKARANGTKIIDKLSDL